MSVVSVDKVSKVFGQGGTTFKALDQVSLTVEPGEVVLVMGPSGSGKTTLLSIIGTLMRPTTGDVILARSEVSKLRDGELARIRLRELGFIFQSFNLLSALTAEENVAVPLVTAGMSRTRAADKARQLLTELRLESRLKSLPKDLSGGEKQRVAIARALANDPKVILADEPTASLDTRTGHEVMELLCNLARSRDQAIIIVSHDPRLRDMATRVITLEDGRIVREEQGLKHDSSLHTTARRSVNGT